MRQRDFDRLIVALTKASPAQLRAAEERLTEINSSREALRMADHRLDQGACPHCKASSFHRWGRTPAGVQRYRCDSCSKTFTALTGTPFNGVHNKARLLENASCMREFLSVRKAARRLGVHRNTAFRYRHRMMPALAKHQPRSLEGVAEADEMFFRRSYKGQKASMPRAPYKRGTPAKKRGLSSEQVPVFTVLSRGSSSSLIEVFPGPASAALIEGVLRPVVKDDVVLCSDSASACKKAGDSLGILVRRIPRGSHKLGPYHIQNANALHSRVKGRMRGFRGVATKHLAAYLGWIRFFDRDDAPETARRFLLDAFDVSAA